jgi:hypothetical protein
MRLAQAFVESIRKAKIIIPGVPLIDEILDLHDRMVGGAFAKAKRAYETSFQEAGRAINEKVRLYAQVGQALIEAKDADRYAFFISVQKMNRKKNLDNIDLAAP